MHAGAARADRSDPEGQRVSERFAPVAVRLCGQAALLLGWTPQMFWDATPEDLATVLNAMRMPDGGSLDRKTIDRLMEQDRGG